MLLMREVSARREAERQFDQHVSLVAEVFAGRADLASVHGEKLARTLVAAVRSQLYEGVLPQRLRETVDGGELVDPHWALSEVFPALPLLEKPLLSELGHHAFTREVREFLHYYESSGTTGNPIAAPKAVDDLVVNTVNIGEMWGRIVRPGDMAMILINAPFAPAAYQFEKVLEYLGVNSLRPWVDNITGDYSRVLRLVEELAVNVFVGPPSRLLELIQFARRQGAPIPRFDTLLLMAEQTGPSFVRHLERLTGARAFVAAYGSSETGTTAVSCEAGSLHLQVQSYLLELYDDSGTRLVDGRPDRGELVVTTLDLAARPLLRYRTGDLVEVDSGSCGCGLALPVLRTQGRSQDVLSLTDRGIRQNDVEAMMWSPDAPKPVVLNYMLILRAGDVVCLTTTDEPPGGGWSEEMAARLAELFPGRRLVARAVEQLPPLASLGQYLGWKLSRVLDLDEERNWDRLPGPIEVIVRQTLDQLASS
ncbi:phenylacetate--CoA ligase family protein [Streptomyces sp. NPDC005279]|uniref:phenylacetate--CoA ligase family protein n=1 Tax=Streptomyces sp. NPDC005279 TaxID=3364712 RepID=UPI0036B06F6E